MQRTIRLALFLLSFLLCGWAGWTGRANGASAASAPATQPLSKPREFFDPDRLWSFHFHLTQDAWTTMQPSRMGGMNRFFGVPMRPATQPTTRKVDEDDRRVSPFGLEYTYVSADVDFEGKTFRNVGIRFKGNASYTSTENTLKHPFKIDFNHFVPGQKFLGMGNLNFHNNSFDPSQMRETLSYMAFRDAGVAAPRTTYALIYLTVDGLYDRQCLGLYTVTEQISRDFLKAHFGSSKGLLLKPEGVRDLPYMGDSWPPYKDRYRPHTDETPQTTQRCIELLRLVHQADDATFRREIASYLDIDNFLRFLAVNALLCNYDSFLIGGHNFYLYIHPNGRAYMMPWDMHLSLGSFGPLGPDQQPQASIAHPHVGAHAIIDRVLAIDEYNAIYRRHLQRLIATSYSAANLQAEIDKVQRVIDEADRQIKLAMGKAPTTMPVPRFVRPTPPLKEFLARRVESVAAQLAGKGEGVVPTFGQGQRMAPPRPLDAPSLAGDLRRWAGADKDGRLTRPALLAATESFFKQADKTKRGWITETDIAAVLSPFLPPAPNRPQRGLLDAFVRRPQSPAFIFARVIMRMGDANRDSRLTRSELMTAVESAFARADRNGDGALDEKELIQALADRLPAPFNAIPAPGAVKPAPPAPATRPARGN